MRSPFHTPICMLIALLLALPAAADSNTFETRLDNGMRLIVREDRRAPTAVHMVWYPVGSIDEVDGSSGLAHLLEHMMFKGTPGVGPGEFNRRVAAAGGRDNAFTSRDYTAYFQQVPKEKLDEMMALEADRMRHLSLDPKEFAQEIKVVMEERRMRTDDNPHAKLFEQMHAVAFQAHPYRRPIIGWMDDLVRMRVEDARAFYQRWYAPNNAWLVVVGDVDHREVFRQAAKHYGPIPARALPQRVNPQEPAQEGPRRLQVKAPADLPLLALAFKVPLLRDAANDRDPYALQMLAAILDGYDAARLPKKLLRENRLALSVGAEYDATARGPGLFYLHGAPAAGKAVAELETALRGEIARIGKDGVAPAELERARAQLLAAQIYQRDSMFGQAMEIGQLESAGHHWQTRATMLDRLQAVTAAEVQAVAQKYFGDDGLTVATLDPQALAGQARPAAASRH